MANIAFDVEGARKAGFTDAAIAERLAKEAGFDVAGARKAGFQDADIIGRLTQPAEQPASTVPPTTSAPVDETPGIGETLLIGAGRTFDRVGKGMQQMWYGATGNDAAAADLKARAEEDDRIYKQLQAKRPIATAVGEALPSMTIPIGSTANVPTTIAKLFAAGAAPEALKYGSVDQRAKEAVEAGAASVAGGYLVPTALRAGTNAAKNTLKGIAGEVTPESAALYARAQQLGVPVNTAQLGDSRFLKTLSSTIEQLPFTGAAKSNTNQAKAYNRAISRTFGDNTENITAEVYRRNRTRLGNTFEALSARNDLQVTPALTKELTDIADEAAKFANPDTEKSIRTIIEQYTSRVQGGPVPAQVSPILNAAGMPIVTKPATNGGYSMPGKAYQAMDSKISAMRKVGGEKGLYLAQVQDAVRNAMDNSISPADKAAWDTARQQYRNLKLIRDVVARDGGSGDITPMALMTALNRSEAGKEAMARGVSGDVGDLAKIGKQFIRDPIPNSGTIQRGISMGLLGGGGIAFGVDPATMIGLMAGSATTGRALNKALNSPKVAQSLGNPRLSMQDIMLMNPSRMQQVMGAGNAMTIENRMDQ